MGQEVRIRFTGDSTSAVLHSQRTAAGLGAVGSAGARVSRILKTTLLVGAAALAAGLGYAGKAAIDFESAMAGVEKTVEGTPRQLAAIEQGIRDMAKEIPTGTSALADIAASAGQLGIETDAVLKFTRTIADLNETTNLAGEEGAQQLARFANITQMAQGDFDRLGSTIVDLGNNLATTEAEIVEMGLRIAGAGKQVGLTEPQILGLAGALSSVGIEAQAGGTAVSRAMVTIEQAVRKGGDELDGFARVAGVSSEEFAKAWEDDAAGALVLFIEGLADLKKEGGDVFGVLEDLELGEIRVRDALLRASGAGDLFRRSINLGSQAWEENIALAEEAQKRYETNASQIDILRNRVHDFAISAGQRLLPDINAAVGGAMDALERHSASIEAGFDVAVSVLRDVLGAARDVGQAIGPDIGVPIAGAVTSMGLFSAAVYNVVKALKALRLAMVTTNPILAGVTIAIGLLSGAYLAAKLHTDFFTEATERAKDALQEVADAALGAKEADIDLASSRNSAKLAALGVEDAERLLRQARQRGKQGEIVRAEALLEQSRINAEAATLRAAQAEQAAAEAHDRTRAAVARSKKQISALAGELDGVLNHVLRQTEGAFGLTKEEIAETNRELRKEAAAKQAKQLAQVAEKARAIARELDSTNPKLATSARRLAATAETAAALATAWGRVIDLPTARSFVARFKVITTIEERRAQLPGRTREEPPEHRQLGGPVTRGRSYLVGESGPELFIPEASGRIASHAQTRADAKMSDDDLWFAASKVVRQMWQAGKFWWPGAGAAPFLELLRGTRHRGEYSQGVVGIRRDQLQKLLLGDDSAERLLVHELAHAAQKRNIIRGDWRRREWAAEAFAWIATPKIMRELGGETARWPGSAVLKVLDWLGESGIPYPWRFLMNAQFRGNPQARRRQHGGPFLPGHAYLVGEGGPELAVFGRAGTMLTHAQTRRTLGSAASGAGLTVNVVIPGATFLTGDRRAADQLTTLVTKGLQRRLVAQPNLLSAPRPAA